jgi:hypothetical protein
MYQKQISWLAGAMLTGFAAAALAGTPDPQIGESDAMPDTLVQQAAKNHALAHKMMGHINLAQMALNLHLPAEAEEQVRSALGIEKTLESQMPELTINSSFEFGKVTYDDKSTMKDNYIPVIDEVFLVNEFDEIYKHANVVDVDQLSAGVVHIQVSADLLQVKDALRQAENAITSEDYGVAAAALQDVFNNAIINEEEVDDPNVMITENLALAKAFVAQEQYDNARLTVEHVQDKLKDARKGDLKGIDEKSLASFSTQLEHIRADLRQKDPTLLQRVSNGLDHWEKKISGWLS